MILHLTSLHPCVRRVIACVIAAAAVMTSAPPAAAAEQHPITNQAMDNYWRGDFVALEQQYLALRRGEPLLEDGTLKLELFRHGLNRVTGATVKSREPYLRELEALTLQWAQQHPKSALAHILHAGVLDAHGWSYRGDGYANTVTPEGSAQFKAYLRQAAAYLKTHADVALTDSSAHLQLLRIGRGLAWDTEDLERIVQAGLLVAPHDVQLYFNMVFSLLPKWHGNPRMLDEYIGRVTKATAAQFGTGMYARLYSYAADEQFSHRLFDDSLADWGKMKRGYEDMHARFPISPTRRNRFAYMACLAKDRPTLRALLAELGPQVDASQWGANPERTLEGCQRWAEAN